MYAAAPPARHLYTTFLPHHKQIHLSFGENRKNVLPNLLADRNLINFHPVHSNYTETVQNVLNSALLLG